eukprot:12490657-Alexandrium_andersonii.AAC.1
MAQVPVAFSGLGPDLGQKPRRRKQDQQAHRACLIRYGTRFGRFGTALFGSVDRLGFDRYPLA